MDDSSTSRALRLAVASLFIMTSLAAAPAALAQEEEKKPWQPQAPEGMPTEFDWIRLPSDEWLKGEIIAMYDGTFEFDSDELDKLSFDFDDIKELRSSRVVQVGFENRDPAIGRVYMDGDTVTITGDTGEVQFDRSEILTIIVGTPKEINYWSGYADIGGNVRSGNTDQLDYTARLGAMRRSLRSRVKFDYLGNITRVDVKETLPDGTVQTRTEETSNNQRITLGWDWFLTKRLYVNVIGAEWYRDPFQNIANRYSVTAGLGYQIIDTSRTTWDVTLGPAWISTEYDSVEEGEDDTTDSGAARLGTRFDYEITGDIDFYAVYDATFTNEENGTYLHHLDTGLDFDLIGNLDFNISWVWDRVQDPRPLEDETVPEQDDFRFIFGLGWDF
jgi:putative salt-induced outer membrane protein YdiY